MVDHKHTFKEVQRLFICQSFVILSNKLLKLLLMECFVLKNVSDLRIRFEFVFLNVPQDIISPKHLSYLAELVNVVISLENDSLLKDLS